jgi:hypothetical protein
MHVPLASIVLLLRLGQAVALIYVGFTLSQPGVSGMVLGITLAVAAFAGERFTEWHTKRSELELRIKLAMRAFHLDDRTKAIVYLRWGWTFFKLSGGRICKNPKRLSHRTREVTRLTAHGYNPAVKPSASTGAAGRAYLDRKVIAGCFDNWDELKRFSLDLGMSNRDSETQAWKASIYTVPIWSENYPVGAIYMSSPVKEEFNCASTSDPEPQSGHVGDLRRMLELIADELAVGG